jgi:hypothetical protein
MSKNKKKLDISKSPRGNDESIPEEKIIKLGWLVKDSITGFEGIAVGIVSFISGCDRVIIKPRGLHDGRTIKSEHFHLFQVQVVDENPIIPEEYVCRDVTEVIQFGYTVKDKVTGFEGIAVGRLRYLYSCDQIMIQPVEVINGKTADTESFDVGRVTIVSSESFEASDSEPQSGPGPLSDPFDSQSKL